MTLWTIDSLRDEPSVYLILRLPSSSSHRYVWIRRNAKRSSTAGLNFQIAVILNHKGTQINFNSCFFASQPSKYAGATKAGMIRGGYHFARPDTSNGAAQAKFSLAHGGSRGWSSDGKTLPGASDIEYGPKGKECYRLSHSAMVSWISDFSSTYHAATKRYPVIYTTTDWWKTYTGNSAKFGSTNPLWIAHYSSSIGTLPRDEGTPFSTYITFRQYADKGPNPEDQDIFNGDAAGLKRSAMYADHKNDQTVDRS
ncbi:glycoside hydrolase superfamily [Mycena capillaripes]|nr:glycoside hydrolase superfamily [Mycena capillaripes]